MMLHILSPGPASPNAAAFLFPLLLWRRQLRDHGIQWRLFQSNHNGLCDCDVLGIDARYYSSRWQHDATAVMEELHYYRERVSKLVWFDISDSSGVDQFRPLPIVDLWVKNQVLRDRNLYMQPLYAGGRLWCHYYHLHDGVEDKDPLWSEPPMRSDDLNKLRVGWNSGLADYTLTGPSRMMLYRRFRWHALLRFPDRYVCPEEDRPIDIACRFGTAYQRESVAWQRRRITDAMAGETATGKLGRRRYLTEMTKAKIVISPFGLGEITLKDFEALRCGTLLIKPEMSHMETWPDLFRAGETMLTHRWNLSNFQDVLNAALSHPHRIAMAQYGQDIYRDHTSGPDAPEKFARHLSGILDCGTERRA